MDALILAAGEGTRLLPLTRTRPKPLFPILNRPLLERTFNYLSHFSVSTVILNTHHLAGQIDDFVQTQKEYSSFEIETRFEPQILNTGGGIGNSRNFLCSDPFVVVNGDILTDIDLNKAIEFHQSHKGPVTLILHDYSEFNHVAVDSHGRIKKLRDAEGHTLAFTGIHILDQNVFNFLPASGSYDIIPIYEQMIREGLTVWAYISQDHYWRDIGTPGSYLKVHEELLSAPRRSKGDRELSSLNNTLKAKRTEGFERILIHPEAHVEKGVEISGWACIGKGCLLKTGCRIHNSVLWEDVTVESEASVSETILGKGVHLKDDLHGGVLI